MLKKFFTVFLGSVAAIWFSILVFIGIIIVAVVSWLNVGSSNLKSNSVLHLCLNGQIEERFTNPSFQGLVMGNDYMNLTFDEISRAVKCAKTDSDIRGIFLDLRGSSMGLAMREELRQLLSEFKESEKFIVAYADNYDQGDFYTASIADELYINPSGTLSANGLSAVVPFFKNALDKLGVGIQVIKVGTFKSAVEPFILTQMSDSARMQYDVMLNTMWDSYTTGVVSDLGLAEDSVSMFKSMAATPMTAFTAKQLVAAKFFDDTKYAYQVHEILKKKAGSGDELNLVDPKEYLATMPSDSFLNSAASSDHIAVLYAVGDIVDSGDEGIVGETMAPLIVSLADNDKVKGLVLRINSGGGSAFASEQIWASLEYFKSKKKPFVVSMSDVAASGGYYIACGADKIYADPSTITGSIGIFGVIPYAQKLLNDKIGINFSVVETNPNAVFPRIDAPLTPDQHAALEKNIKEGYDLFVHRVATGRNMADSAVRKIAEGRVWAGSTAKEIGLVDELGSLEDAIAYVSLKTDIRSECVSYPVIAMTPLQQILLMNEQELKVSWQNEASKALGISADDLREGARILSRVRSMNTIQARMEDIRVY